MKHLKDVCIAIATYATSRWNTCDIISSKHRKYLKRTLETYMYNHSNICNIQVKHLKHRFATCVYCHIPNLLLQHPDETFETRRRRRLRPIWWGTAVASKLGSGDVKIKLLGLLSRMHNLYKPRGVYAHDIYFFFWKLCSWYLIQLATPILNNCLYIQLLCYLSMEGIPHFFSNELSEEVGFEI
jgi:hypothetical protein